ncbi:MAG: AI-2E family transporter [Comamonas sp.]|jgi:predicted PurR-regulated permease PerM|nr:AI-2E family transporter [Comamonas sp.]
MRSSNATHRTFLLLLTGVSLGFAAILWPFLGAIFWAMVLAILFQPLNRRLRLRLPRKPNLATFATLLTCVVLAVFPLTLIAISVVQETTAIYSRMASGQLNFGAYFQQIYAALPSWVGQILEGLGLADLAAIEQKLSSLATEAGKVIAGKAVELGSNTLGFAVSFSIMLYLLYFLLRDGQELALRVRDTLPLERQHKQELIEKFATVIRATVKGNLVVAAAQGALGGLIFWLLGIQGALLWGVLMAFLSLLPAVGASLIWGPVCIYYLATGDFTRGLILAAYGVMVIGLVDNLLRPLLVGKDTKLPDYIVLISTLGGMSLFGLTGFVIGPVIAALFIACWDIYSQPCPAPDAVTQPPSA